MANALVIIIAMMMTNLTMKDMSVSDGEVFSKTHYPSIALPLHQLGLQRYGTQRTK